MRIGLISDTHGHFDPRIPALFHSVDHILHAGDVGSARILDELASMAPVTAVEGNTDVGIAGLHLPLTEVLKLEGTTFLIHHIVTPENGRASIGPRFETARPDVVVFGHSHRAFDRRVGGVRFINPGYAGRPRFGSPRSVMILEELTDDWVARIVTLDGE